MLRKAFPSILTMLSLLSGITGIFFAFSSGFEMAMWALLLAAFFDFTDGFAARKLNATSEFGIQLDSLSDMVSFGVLPGVAGTVFMANIIGVHSVSQFVMLRFTDAAVVAIPLLIPVFSALRLAKFNIDPNQKEGFVGLPTPANAIFILALINFLMIKGSFFVHNIAMFKIGYALVFILLALLLVIPLKLFALKFRNYSIKDNWYRYVLLLASFVFFIVWGLKGIILIIPAYIALSLLIVTGKGSKH